MCDLRSQEFCVIDNGVIVSTFLLSYKWVPSTVRFTIANHPDIILESLTNEGKIEQYSLMC